MIINDRYNFIRRVAAAVKRQTTTTAVITICRKSNSGEPARHQYAPAYIPRYMITMNSSNLAMVHIPRYNIVIMSQILQIPYSSVYSRRRRTQLPTYTYILS